MSLKRIDILSDDDALPDLQGVLREVMTDRPDGRTHWQLLVRADDVADILDAFDDAEIMVMPVEVVLPAVDGLDDEPRRSRTWSGETSLSEVAERAGSDTQLRPLSLALVACSSVLASLGMVQGNEAVVVGGMVIAPVIGPLLAVAFSLPLGRWRNVWRGCSTAVLSMIAALAAALLIGLVAEFDVASHSLELRTRIGPWDLVIGAAAGVAGAVSYVQDERTAIVGVMVAAALVPPLAALGLCVGAGASAEALGALALVVINVVCIVAVGAVAFVSLGAQRAAFRREGSGRVHIG